MTAQPQHAETTLRLARGRAAAAGDAPAEARLNKNIKPIDKMENNERENAKQNCEESVLKSSKNKFTT